MRVRGTVTVVAVTTVLAVVGVGPAGADGARTLTGPVTGDADVFMTYVGCDSIFGSAVAPQSRLNLGPYSAPLGRRSLGLVPVGTGSASGPRAAFGSLAAVDSSVSVAATGGSQGVAHLIAVTPTNPTGTAWSGRAAIAVPPGSWTTVSAAALTYEWALVDLASGAPLAPAGSATPAAFASEHGDGAGLVVTGFGCDGKPFNLDAVRASGSTFDFEGIALTTTMAAERLDGGEGGQVAITGRVTDGSGRVTGDPLVLESRAPGGTWAPVGEIVLADRQGLARVVVPVSETTEFRWHRPESQYADEGWSDPVTVTVTRPAQPEPPEQAEQPEQAEHKEHPGPPDQAEPHEQPGQPEQPAESSQG